jgi:uncharacterized protein
MKISVKAKPLSREPGVTKIDESTYEVAVKEPPVQGRANQAIIKALAEYFKVPVFKVRIVNGHISRQKIVEIAT